MTMPTPLIVGDSAPPLQSQAVKGGEVVDLTLDSALAGADYLLLVFYPADFTFVCPTEIVQFTERHADFAAQRCNIVCCSTDSVFTHLAWLKAPRSERGLGAAGALDSVVLLSDRSHEISRAYGVLDKSGAAFRGTFLIDKEHRICQATINDMPVGRSVDDALRMLTELCAAPVKSSTSGGVTGSRQQVNTSNAGSNAATSSPIPIPPGKHQPARRRRICGSDQQKNSLPIQRILRWTDFNCLRQSTEIDTDK